MSVLVAEPDRVSADQLTRALSQHATVVTVPTIQAATAAVRAWTPHLIVTELNLPDGDGLELLARVHTTPATRHVLLMVVTRRRGVHDKIAAFRAGADDYLVKPVDLRDFETHMLLVSRFRRILPP